MTEKIAAMSSDFEDLAYPPHGERLKLILLGVLIPGLIAYFAIDAWAEQQAYWPGGRGGGRGMTVRGEAAQALAVAYLSIGAFLHFRWFWGMLQADQTFRIGSVCSMLTFLAALLWAVSAL